MERLRNAHDCNQVKVCRLETGGEPTVTNDKKSNNLMTIRVSGLVTAHEISNTL